MNKDNLKVTIIIFVLILILSIIRFVMLFKINDKINEVKWCKIESVEVKHKYETLPELKYVYKTECGDVTLNNNTLNVGDSILIKKYK